MTLPVRKLLQLGTHSLRGFRSWGRVGGRPRALATWDETLLFHLERAIGTDPSPPRQPDTRACGTRVLAYNEHPGCSLISTSAVSHARSEDERLQFMAALQAVWSVHGRSVMAAFDLSPFPRICDLGGECLLQMLGLRSDSVRAAS